MTLFTRGGYEKRLQKEVQHLNEQGSWKQQLCRQMKNMTITVAVTFYIVVIGIVSLMIYDKLRDTDTIILIAASIGWLLFNILIISIPFYLHRRKAKRKR